jgi:hypothetical protein
MGQICGCNRSSVIRLISDLLCVGGCALRDGNIVHLMYICLVFIFPGLPYVFGWTKVKFIFQFQP